MSECQRARNHRPDDRDSDLLSDEEDEEDTNDDDDDDDIEPSARQAAMDALVAPLEPGEYGKMPVNYRHPNTQTTTDNNEDAGDLDKTESTQVKDTSKPAMRPLVFQRDEFDGVDSDDETSEEEDRNVRQPVMGEDGEELENDDDGPQVLGEVEIDMAQEEEDFLRFSREALGIDDDTWNSIIADREKRGGE